MKRMITNRLSAAALVAVAALFAASFSGCDCGGKENVELTLIQVTPVDEEITMEQTVQYQATGIYSDGTNEDLSDLVTWASEDEGVATIDENGLATPVAGGETTISATYQGITGNATLTVVEKDLERIEVTPATATLAIGTTQQLQATGFYTDGTTEDLTADADWASSDDAVATVTAGGLVEGVTEGTATITATVGTFDDTATITVLGVGVTCETLTIETVSGDTTVPQGLTLEFVANCAFSDGENRDVTTQATWASSDTGTATISNDTGSQGELLGVAEGTTNVTAAYDNADGTTTDSNTVTVTVVEGEPTEIQVTPVSHISHAADDDVDYTATCILPDDSTYDCTTAVTWDSSDEAVATISNATGSEGVATTHGAGTTMISAQLGTVTSNDAVLIVDIRECESIDVTPAAPDVLPIGLTQQFEATCTYADGSSANVTTLATWASSNTAFATISNAVGEEGLATGVAAGTTQITATYNAVVSPAVALTVAPITAVSILVEPAALVVPVGSTGNFTATVTFNDMSTRNVTADAGCTWTSSAPTVATVLAGTVTGVSAGGANITATFSGVSDTKPVTVIPGTLDRIDVAPTNGSTPVGTDLQFTAMGHYTDGSYINITTSATWTSSNTGIATISNTMGTEGLAHGVTAGGPITITATSGGISGTGQLTVTGATITSINVTPALPPDLPVGLTQQFQATCTYSDLSNRPCTTDAALTWASSDTAVARISNDAADKGLAVGVATGNTQITASVGAVTSPPVVLRVISAVLTSIDVLPDPGRVPAGFSIAFTAQGYYSDGSNRPITDSVTWSSSNTGVATVSNLGGLEGHAHGVAPGTTVITASLSGVDGTSDLTVTNAVLGSVQVTPAALDINEGESYQFTATGFFTDGSTVDITEDIDWYFLTDLGFCPACWGAAGTTISNTPGSRGLFTAGAYGHIEILVYGYGIYSNIVNIEIRSTTLDHVVTTLPRNDVPVGHNFQAQCEAYYQDGSHSDVTASATWSSSVTTVATVSNTSGSEGLISTAGAGNTNITCDFGGASNAAQLRVYACTLNSIDVVPNNPTASIGTTVQFTANGTYGSPCNSSAFVVTEMANWNSSNTAIATISNTPGSKGLASVVASTGFSDIEGRIGTVFDTSRLTATGACIDSVYISPAAPTIPVGVDVNLDAYGCLSTDTACASPVLIGAADVNWQSSAPATATVSESPDGLLTGVAAGTSTITATLTTGACTPGEQGTTLATVSSATLSSIAVEPANQTIGLGQQLQYRAMGTYSDGSTHDITARVVWTSTVTSIATIGAGGLATALAQGTTQITAARGGVTGFTSLSVGAKVLTSLAVSVSPAQPPAGYPVGIYVQFSCTATYSDSSTGDVTASATFGSSSDTVLTVDNAAATKGRGTTNAIGSANVTCSVGTTVSPAFAVTVNNATLQTIVVAPASATIAKGTQQQFTATGTYSNGTSFPITRRVTWSSSDTAIAGLSNTEPTQGLATASVTNSGTVTVSAIYGGVTGTGQLTVSGACIDHIEVTPTSTSVIAGYNVSFTATAVNSDTSTSNITATASWSSSSTGVATVAAGVAHGVAQGTATITASTSTNTCSGTESDDATLDVSTAELTGITVSCDSTTPPPGLQTQCRAYGTYSDGTSGVNITTQVSWSSTNTAVATVSNTDPTQGLVNAVATGNATITATRGTIQGTQTINVPNCSLSTIDVTPNSQNVPVSFTVQYAATGTWTAACGTHNISAYVGWDSSTPATATISATGLATAVAAGTTAITATYLSIVGTEPLTVNAATLQNIDVEAGTCGANLPDGGSCKMEARGYFTDGSNRLVTEDATWSSNNGAAATAGNTPGDKGRISAVDPGSAVITAVVGTHSDNRPITVTSACLQTIQVTPVGPSYPVDVYGVFTATGVYSDTSTQNLTSTAGWGSTNTGVIAVPDGTGKALTNGTGTSTVSAQSNVNTCTGSAVTGNTTVTVTSATLNTIEVEPGSPRVPNGTTQQMTAWGNYSDGGRYDITRRVTWASANTVVAAISNAPGSNGLATANSIGTTLISATKGTISGSTTMTVTDAILTGITVTTDAPYVGWAPGNTVRYPENGLQIQFHATGAYSDGSFRDVTDIVGWSGNNDTAATVSLGLVTTGTVSADTTVRITAASGSVSGYLDIVVMNGAPTAIAITGGLTSIANGTSTQWACIATMGAYQYYVSRSTAWTSDNETIASVSNAEDEWGEVTGNSVGSTTIWARWSTLSTNRNIAVTAAVLSWIEVTPGAPTVTTDAFWWVPFYLYITGHYTDGTTQDLTYSGGYFNYDGNRLYQAWYDTFYVYDTGWYQSYGWCDQTTTVVGCYGGMCSTASGHDAHVLIDCP